MQITNCLSKFGAVLFDPEFVITATMSDMDHTLDIHNTLLNELCRTCGKKNMTEKDRKKRNYPRLCEHFSVDILLVFGLNIQKDNLDSHSKHICFKCYSTIRNVKKRGNESSVKAAKARAEECNSIWCQFDINKSTEECSVCKHRTRLNIGCIEEKRCSHFEPSQVPQENMQEHVTDTMNTAGSIDLNQFTPNPTNTIPALNTTTEPEVQTFTRSLSRPVSQPLTKDEMELHLHLTRRQIHNDPLNKSNSPQNQILKIKTKGQPLIYKRVVNPRKSSAIARSPTKKKRARLLQRFRQNVAGTSKDDEECQFASEIKKVPKVRRQRIMKKAGQSGKVKLSKECSLAMKETLGLSWRQEGTQRKFLKKIGVETEGEKAIRSFSKEIVSNFVYVKNQNFLNEQNFHIDVPFGRIVHLTSFVDRLLDAYNANNMLTWHNKGIPEGEIWVKIGGDHGKNSLKFTLQIGNIHKPNARQNTVVIGMASVKDSFDNLQAFLQYGIGDELKFLQEHQWQNKHLRIFLNGDYAFLSRLYGLSGPQGVFPCLWCLMPRKMMHSQPFHTYQARTLQSLRNDHDSFKRHCQSDKKQAHKFHNSLHSPLIDIPLGQVVPPYLHILLGIVLKHHKLLETSADTLDTSVSRVADIHLTSLGQIFKKYGSQWKTFLDLEKKIEFLKTNLIFSDTEDDKIKYRKQITEAELALSNVGHRELTPRSGPISSSLDNILSTHKITPQAYHSRAFVGNHCHKYLSPQVYNDLTNNIIEQTRACTNFPDLVDKAHIVANTFNQLNAALSSVHQLVSHSKPVDINSLSSIQSQIDAYMSLFRQSFTNKIIPKQHILEKHCVPWMKEHLFGLGLMGEQGTEASHQAIAKLDKRACGITNAIQKMEFILKSHLLHVTPELQRHKNNM